MWPARVVLWLNVGVFDSQVIFIHFRILSSLVLAGIAAAHSILYGHVSIVIVILTIEYHVWKLFKVFKNT